MIDGFFRTYQDAKLDKVVTLFASTVLFVTAVHYQMVWRYPGCFGPTVKMVSDGTGRLRGEPNEAIPQSKPAGSFGAWPCRGARCWRRFLFMCCGAPMWWPSRSA